MHTAPFEYHRAESVDDALRLLGQYGDEAKLLAGGHSLIPVMKLRFAQPAHLIDIRRIPGMAEIREEGNDLVVGALTTYRQIITSGAVRQRAALLGETAAQVGDLQVRNMGTIGGSLAHADPGADMPAAVLALGATVVARGPQGERRIPADEYFVGFFTSALAENEVLTEIRIPGLPPRAGSAYEKHAHPASGYALCGAAVVVSLNGQGAIETARVALTGIGSKAIRASGVEQALQGGDAAAEAIAAAAARAAEGIDMRPDEAGVAGYNENLARVCVKRALTRALERARSA
jgi:aerobic carbon-monoxide dehydrogenase medium subunit